jgi:hypothetical protein
MHMYIPTYFTSDLLSEGRDDGADPFTQTNSYVCIHSYVHTHAYTQFASCEFEIDQ